MRRLSTHGHAAAVRKRREPRYESVRPACNSFHIHSRVVEQVGFGQGGGHAATQGDRERKTDNRPRLDAVERGPVEFFLLRSRETPVSGSPARVIGSESELRALSE